MLGFTVAPLLLLELIVFIVLCLLLYPLRRYPGVRIYYWLGTISAGAWAVEFLHLTEILPLAQTARSVIFLLIWVAFPLIGLGLFFDLQGELPGIFPLHKKWPWAALLAAFFLAIGVGLLLSGSRIWLFVTWAVGSGVLLYGLLRFLRRYRNAFSRYRLFTVLTVALLVMTGWMGIWGIWGLPWNSISLVLTGIFVITFGSLFLQQRSVLRRLGEDHRSQSEEAAETWFLLDSAGRILDFDGKALRFLRLLREGVIGREIEWLLPQMRHVLGEIENNQLLDVDLEDDFFGTTRMCRFSLFFPLQVQTIFEPRILKIRALPSLVFEPQGQEGAVKGQVELLRQVTLMQSALDAFSQGIMITDSVGKVVYRNQILIEMLDLSDQSLQVDDVEWKDQVARRMKDPERFTNFISQILDQAVGETLDILECSDGRLLECRTRFYFVDSIGGGLRLWSFTDCTEQQRRERELQHMGMHDTLTGIYNRAFFEMKLRQLRLVSLYPVCMFMVDVDGLKHVNDFQGHSTGDLVLRQAAYVLRQACRTDDIVARLGGDEFGLLLINADKAVAEQVAVRVQGLLNMYNIRHPDIPLSISVGYSIAENPKEMESLVARADEAMYESRRKHRARQG